MDNEVTKNDIVETNKTLATLQETIKEVAPKLQSFEEKFNAADSETKEKLAKITGDLEKSDKKLQDALLEAEKVKSEKRSKEEEMADLEKIIAEKSMPKEKEAELTERIKDLELQVVSSGKDKDNKTYIKGEEYVALTNFVKGKLSVENTKYLRTDDGANGGYLVPVELNQQILEEVEELNPIRPLARTFSSKTKTLEIPIRTSLPVATFEGEAEENTEDNSEYRLETLTAYAQTITTPLTWDMINFGNNDMIQQASKDAAMAFAIGEGTGFLSGTGIKEPAGIISNATIMAAAGESAGAGAVSLTDVIPLPGFLKSGYITNARFFMNQKTLFALRAEQDDNGNFLWRVGGEGMPNNIAGIPYVILPGMADVAEGSYSVGVGDFFYGYYILDAVQIAMVRDEVTEARKRIVKLTWFKWLTGQVGIAEAFKLLKTAASD